MIARKTLEKVWGGLEKRKDDYSYVYYNPKTDNIFLVKSVFDCEDLDGKVREYVRYADAKLFGKEIQTKRAVNWEYIGRV